MTDGLASGTRPVGGNTPWIASDPGPCDPLAQFARSARACIDEWMRFLNDNADAVRETLEPEQMCVETIFCETVDGVDYLYWYSVPGEDGTGTTCAEISAAHRLPCRTGPLGS